MAGAAFFADTTFPARVTLARPEGFEHTPPTFVVEGVEELMEALLAA